MFEAQMAKGIEYLDLDLGLSWPERIDLSKLDMGCGYRCVIGQLYGHLTERFGAEDGIPYGFDIYLTDDRRKRGIQTQEWKEKIIQLRAERKGHV